MWAVHSSSSRRLRLRVNAALNALPGSARGDGWIESGTPKCPVLPRAHRGLTAAVGLTLLLAMFVLVGQSRTLAATPAAMDLGTLGGPNSWATSVNDNTQIVGYAQTAAGAWHAFSWTATTGMVDLGTLGGTSSFAASINNSGQVVGYSTTATGATHAFSWTSAGGMVDLGTLGGSYSKAAAASAAGQVVGSATTVAGATHAFSWTVAGGMVDLGTLPGGVSSDGIAVNLAGAVAGDSYPSSGGPHVFFWTAARGMVDVGTLGGQQNYSSFCGRSQCGDPSVLNATGEVVGGSSICCYHRDAFSWTSSGGIVDLGILPGGSFSDAHAVNDAGQDVGGRGCACK